MSLPVLNNVLFLLHQWTTNYVNCPAHVDTCMHEYMFWYCWCEVRILLRLLVSKIDISDLYFFAFKGRYTSEYAIIIMCSLFPVFRNSTSAWFNYALLVTYFCLICPLGGASSPLWLSRFQDIKISRFQVFQDLKTFMIWRFSWFEEFQDFKTFTIWKLSRFVVFQDFWISRIEAFINLRIKTFNNSRTKAFNNSKIETIKN